MPDRTYCMDLLSLGSASIQGRQANRSNSGTAWPFRVNVDRHTSDAASGMVARCQA